MQDVAVSSVPLQAAAATYRLQGEDVLLALCNLTMAQLPTGSGGVQQGLAQRTGGGATGRATAAGAARHVRRLRGQLPGARKLHPRRPGGAGAAGAQHALAHGCRGLQKGQAYIQAMVPG